MSPWPTALRLALLVALLVPPVRRWFYQAGLLWLYLTTVAFAIAVFAVPLVRAYALWRGVLDQPAARKVHAVATPLLGGAAVQFLDGMDGLAAGLGVIAGAFFSMTALQTNQRYLMFLSAALVGACLGFLPYNFRPGGARIFLGDSGASFIGFTLAGLAVMGEWAENDPVVALFTPVLILGVPLFDIIFVSIVRVVTQKVRSLPEWLAYTGKAHLHHRFAALGLTKTQSVLLIFFVAATLGLSAILLKDATPYETALVLIQAGCILALVAVLEGVGRGRPRG